MSQQTSKATARQDDRRPSPSNLPTARYGRLTAASSDALIRPQVTLYINGSEASRSVFELLEGAGVDFRAVASRRPVPLATFGRLRFEGIDGARELVGFLHELDAAWQVEAEQVMPDLVNAPEPHLMAEMERTRARWRRQARAVLARVSAASTVQSENRSSPERARPASAS
jgi:hypothetical protein